MIPTSMAIIAVALLVAAYVVKLKAENLRLKNEKRGVEAELDAVVRDGIVDYFLSKEGIK